MASRSASDRHDSLLRELNEERAAALMRISHTLEGLIERLRELRERLPTLMNGERAAAVRDYDALREQARTYRWYLEVQREAVGLRQHDALDQFYAIPEKLSARG